MIPALGRDIWLHVAGWVSDLNDVFALVKTSRTTRVALTGRTAWKEIWSLYQWNADRMPEHLRPYVTELLCTSLRIAACVSTHLAQWPALRIMHVQDARYNWWPFDACSAYIRSINEASSSKLRVHRLAMAQHAAHKSLPLWEVLLRIPCITSPEGYSLCKTLHIERGDTDIAEWMQYLNSWIHGHGLDNCEFCVRERHGSCDYEGKKYVKVVRLLAKPSTFHTVIGILECDPKCAVMVRLEPWHTPDMLAAMVRAVPARRTLIIEILARDEPWAHATADEVAALRCALRELLERGACVRWWLASHRERAACECGTPHTMQHLVAAHDPAARIARTAPEADVRNERMITRLWLAAESEFSVCGTQNVVQRRVSARDALEPTSRIARARTLVPEAGVWDVSVHLQPLPRPEREMRAFSRYLHNALLRSHAVGFEHSTRMVTNAELLQREQALLHSNDAPCTRVDRADTANMERCFERYERHKGTLSHISKLELTCANHYDDVCDPALHWVAKPRYGA